MDLINSTIVTCFNSCLHLINLDSNASLTQPLSSSVFAFAQNYLLVAIAHNVLVFNMEFKLLHIFSHSRTVTCLDSQNHILVTGSLDSFIHLWDLSSFSYISSKSTWHTGPSSLKLANNIVTSFHFDKLCFWHLNSSSPFCTVPANGIHAIGHFPLESDNLIVTVSSSIDIYDPSSGLLVFSFKRSASVAKFNPFGFLAFAFGNNIYFLSKNDTIERVIENEHPVLNFVFYKDSIATLFDNLQVRFYNIIESCLAPHVAQESTLAVSRTIISKNDAFTSLEDEVRLLQNYTQITVNASNLTHRNLSISLQTVNPNFPSFPLVLDIAFPNEYPFAKLIIEVSSPVNDRYKLDIISSHVDKIIQESFKKSQACLEPICKYLLGMDTTIVPFDSIVLDQENSSESDATDLSFHGKIHLLDSKKMDNNVPFPCLCGAAFSYTGKLVVFMSPLPLPTKEKSFPKTFGLYLNFRTALLAKLQDADLEHEEEDEIDFWRPRPEQRVQSSDFLYQIRKSKNARRRSDSSLSNYSADDWAIQQDVFPRTRRLSDDRLMSASPKSPFEEFEKNFKYSQPIGISKSGSSSIPIQRSFAASYKNIHESSSLKNKSMHESFSFKNKSSSFKNLKSPSNKSHKKTGFGAGVIMFDYSSHVAFSPKRFCFTWSRTDTINFNMTNCPQHLIRSRDLMLLLAKSKPLGYFPNVVAALYFSVIQIQRLGVFYQTNEQVQEAKIPLVIQEQKPKITFQGAQKKVIDYFSGFYEDLRTRKEERQTQDNIIRVTKRNQNTPVVFKLTAEHHAVLWAFAEHLYAWEMYVERNEYLKLFEKNQGAYMTKQFIKCHICRVRCKGISMTCSKCMHGGHAMHITQWFEQFEHCPSGCGCRCEFL